MKINSIQKLIYYSFTIVIIFNACARKVAPTGGPKDEQHPLIVEIDPLDYSINFDKKEINITFDEYVQLNDLSTNLIISPPVEEKPEIKIKGKTLHIEFMEELKDSTTYNIYFGNSVQDINEGNPIENFQYVLSTGTFIDSLSIQGQVINSFNLIPEEGVFVMLYSEQEDSIPLKEIPLYVSKTNEEGLFRINNIRHGDFKLFCLRDLNRNYLFDIVEENIAFIDSLVVFDLVNETNIDTIFESDTSMTRLINRANVIDTIIESSRSFFPINYYTLRLFTEEKAVQYLANNSRLTKQKIEIVFNKEIKDSVVFSVVDTIIEDDWFIIEKGLYNDSLTYWLKDSSLYNREELSFALTYQKEDSNLVYQWNTDTLKLKFFEAEISKKQIENEETDTSLKYSLNIADRGTIDLNKNLNFEFESPLQHFDTTKIDLYAIVDSVEFSVDFDFTRDSLKIRKYNMDVDWCSDTIYRLEIYPNAFTDIYETANDTNIIEFASQKFDHYGRILANITGIDSSFQVISQILLSGKNEENVFREKIIQSDQIVEYDFLPPKEFVFKVILDMNFNGEWDTGDYLKHIQPEEVLYYEEKIGLKSNWDFEVNLNVNK